MFLIVPVVMSDNKGHPVSQNQIVLLRFKRNKVARSMMAGLTQSINAICRASSGSRIRLMTYWQEGATALDAARDFLIASGQVEIAISDVAARLEVRRPSVVELAILSTSSALTQSIVALRRQGLTGDLRLLVDEIDELYTLRTDLASYDHARTDRKVSPADRLVPASDDVVVIGVHYAMNNSAITKMGVSRSNANTVVGVAVGLVAAASVVGGLADFGSKPGGGDILMNPGSDATTVQNDMRNWQEGIV